MSDEPAAPPFEPPPRLDPVAAARQRKAALPKRFYETAAADRTEAGFALMLDGRTARTPARAPLAVPTHPLAEALAAEWNAQVETIDPARMPVTRLVNSAIDGVAARVDEVRDDLARYAGSDLVCYRAAEPEQLVAAQGLAWDPILAWAHEILGARFVLSEGVMFVAQPDPALAAVRARLAPEDDPFRLAALHVMTTLTGSVLIPLAHAGGFLDDGQAWAAAHVDELFQETRWGADQDAAERRAAREIDFRAASRVHKLAGG